MLSSPTTSRLVKEKSAPSASVIFPFLKVRMRYSGPLVSSMIAMGRPSSARTALIMSIFFWCSSWVPWEKFRRATFRPCLHMARKTSGFSLDGPMVQMILVFLMAILLYHVLVLAHTSNDITV